MQTADSSKETLAQYGRLWRSGAGWGGEPAQTANGEYQTFKADKSVNDKANLRRCFECPQAAGPTGLRVLVRAAQGSQVAGFVNYRADPRPPVPLSARRDPGPLGAVLRRD